MTTQAFEQFRRQVNADSGLQAGVVACFSSPPIEGSSGFDKLVSLGKIHGFDFSAQEAIGAKTADGATLSEFELELVSGGSFSRFVLSMSLPKTHPPSKNDK